MPRNPQRSCWSASVRPCTAYCTCTTEGKLASVGLEFVLRCLALCAFRAGPAADQRPKQSHPDSRPPAYHQKPESGAFASWHGFCSECLSPSITFDIAPACHHFWNFCPCPPTHLRHPLVQGICATFGYSCELPHVSKHVWLCSLLLGS